MNTIKIPGFTAEASLFQARDNYQMDIDMAQNNRLVQPAGFSSDVISSSVADQINFRFCWAYRCHWFDISPGAPFPPKIVWRCGLEWIC